MRFDKQSAMKWDGVSVTDHNRSELNIDTERIKKSQRMANGTLREYVIADKKKVSCSWENLPSVDQAAVDWNTNNLIPADPDYREVIAGRGIENFYQTAGVFQVEITDGDNTVTTFSAVMTEFNKVIVKRGTNYDLWNVSISLEEV